MKKITCKHLITQVVTGMALMFSLNASASVVTYSDESLFQAALTGGSTVISTSGANIGLTTAQLSSNYANVTLFGQSSFVRSDGLIPHGAGFNSAAPHIGLNFDVGVNGVGVTSNRFDGGRIQIYSGLNGTGLLLGEADFGQLAPSLFGGMISTDLIRSAIFTCHYNADLKCGLIDPTFGTVSAVPVPAAAWLFGSGLIALVGVSRRKR